MPTFFALIYAGVDFALVLSLILLLRSALIIGGINGMALAGLIPAKKIRKALHSHSGVLVEVLEKMRGMFVTLAFWKQSPVELQERTIKINREHPSSIPWTSCNRYMVSAANSIYYERAYALTSIPGFTD